MKFLNTLSIALFALEITVCEGAPAQSVFHYEGSKGTLEFNQTNSHGISSKDKEYAIILEDHDIILETNRGSFEEPKKIPYAKVTKYSESFGGTIPKTHVYIRLDDKNTPLVKAVLQRTNKEEEVGVNYLQGSYPLIHVKIYPLLKLISDSIAFDEISENHLPSYKSVGGKYKITLEDKGWINFGPPSRSYNPTVTFNPNREFVLSLEIGNGASSKQKVHYATITYPIEIIPQNDLGVYEGSIPLTLQLDKDSILRVSSELPGVEITYPIGLLTLKE